MWMMKIDSLGRSQQFNCHDVINVIEHRVQTPRGERRHADMILLVSGSRNTVDAGRVRVRLVFRGQGGRGYLGHHEATVETAVINEKSGQPAQVAVNQQCNTPLRKRPDFCDCESEVVGRQRDWFGVKISA